MLSVCIFVLTITLFALAIGKAFRKDPLEQFPGPWLAKWTWIYRAYYDIVVGGGWLSHLETLHERYGPVVRVGHNELHFADPSAYTDIYTSFPVHRKDPKFYSTFSLTAPSTFAEMDPKEHAIIRSMIAPFFSRKSVLGLEFVIQEQIDQLIQQLLQKHRSLPVDMDLAFRSVTLDIITLYTFGISINAVSTPLFQHPVLLDSEKHARNKWFFKHFPRIKSLMVTFPSWFAAAIGRKASFSFVKEITKLVDDALNHEDGLCSHMHKNIYHTLLSDSTPTMKKKDRLNRRWLIGEGLNLRGAGSDTVGNICTIGARYLLNDKRVLRKLQDELDTAWQDKDDMFPLERLERLSYLTAVIKESLRLGHGVVTPMPRIVPETGSVITGYHVPAGTSVALGNTFVHMNPVIFPNPTRFYPERWLEEDRHSAERYLVAFGKGSRSCLGITLAWCELYLIFGNLFRKLDLFAMNDIGLSTNSGQPYTFKITSYPVTVGKL
ncbi:hypothetical protein E1B28_009175 [Marasmius oreades]|uniref:Cytochrome P450 n=1 Tax=Marasmius oreades TaxID=181124 RepID=A0A9P7S029_9AGAR|nr:uncharacterized protein E1B28_009175 [Marasmius oreades]KAG7092862.1 hypothetical protein E1B28_009175 [Marasmius oreades]